MKKETIEKLLKIVENAVKENDTKQTGFLMNFFTNRYTQCIDLDVMIEELELSDNK